MRKLFSVLMASLLLVAGLVPAANAFTVSLVPQGPLASAGTSFNVDVVAEGLTGGGAPSLGAWDLNVSFDSSVLAVAGVTFGTGLDVLGLGFNIQGFDDSVAGLLNAYEVSFDSTADLNSLQPGAFTLFTVTFNAMSEGASLLGLTANALGNAEGDALSASALNGSSVSVVAPVPLPAAMWLLISGLAGAGVFRRKAARA
jgi:hypothetical protein